MTARPSDAQLRKLEEGADVTIAGLAAEVRRLRRLLVEIYPHANDTKGTETLLAVFLWKQRFGRIAHPGVPP